MSKELEMITAMSNALMGRFGIDLNDCKWMICDKLIKISYREYIIYYHKEYNHITKLFNIDYHLNKCKKYLHYKNKLSNIGN